MKHSIPCIAVLLLLNFSASGCFGSCATSGDTSNLTVTSIVSRKTHGAPGNFDIDLPRTGTPGVECRSGPYTLVFTFTNNSTVGGSTVAVTSANVSVGTGSASFTTSGMQCTVNLSGVTDQQSIVVTLEGVHDSKEYINVTVPMTIIVGDVNFNGTVNSTDVESVKFLSGSDASAANFRNDLNANGTISSTDVSIVKLASGHGNLSPIPPPLPRLTVCPDDARFLCKDGGNGKFFWLGDTAWWLMNVNDSDVSAYLSRRAAQKFTGIQIMALMLELDQNLYPEFEPAVYDKKDIYLNSPTEGTGSQQHLISPMCKNSAYWTRFKWIVDEAARKGLYVGVFLVWGNEISKPYYFGTDTTVARNYARDLAALLHNNTNVWYSVAGEYDSGSAGTSMFLNLAGGITDDAHDPLNPPDINPIVGIHPGNVATSLTDFPNVPWLNIHMLQSGHQFKRRELESFVYRQTDELIDQNYAPNISNPKPIFDAEPMYENIVDFVWHNPNATATDPRADASIVRFKAYEAVFAGACGHTYGHDNVHSFWTSPDDSHVPFTRGINWKTAANINDPLPAHGAQQLRYLKELIECHSPNRKPDQCFIVIENEPPNEPTCEPAVYTELTHRRAAREYDGAQIGRYALVYLPQGGDVTVDTSLIASPWKASWFNPETGGYGTPIPHDNTSPQTFSSPGVRHPGDLVNDWVLVIESTENFDGCIPQ